MYAGINFDTDEDKLITLDSTCLQSPCPGSTKELLNIRHLTSDKYQAEVELIVSYEDEDEIVGEHMSSPIEDTHNAHDKNVQ